MQDALDKKIVSEDLGAFERRIVEKICTHDRSIIDRTISSMHKRLIEITRIMVAERNIKHFTVSILMFAV